MNVVSDDMISFTGGIRDEDSYVLPVVVHTAGCR